MNAKKIMGAVLVALLAAALFVGAGAAALDEGDNGTYFVYQKDLGSDFEGTWTNGAASIVIDDGVVLPVGDFVPGTYTKGKSTITVLNPSVSYKLTAEYNGIPYLVGNGGTVYNASKIQLTITPLADVTGETWTYNILKTKGSNTPVNESNPWPTLKYINSTGTYKIQALFGTAGFVNGVPADILLDANAFTFKVVKADEATISASVDTVYAGEKITITVVGTPGEGYVINAANVTIAEKQLVVVKKVSGTDNFTFTMPNTGKASFDVKINSTADDEVVMKLIYNNEYVDDGEITIKVNDPVVTAAVGAPAYFIGEEIKVTGTSTSGEALKFNITGTNLAETPLTIEEKSWGKNWEATLTLGKKVDVGTYTIKVYQDKELVATAAVALKQPFISILDAPEVIVQETEVEFLINAESAAGVKAYFFGTNFFLEKTATQEDKDIANEFTVTLKKDDTKASKMATGQYFAVFQHPMYDEKFNILPFNGNFTLNTKGEATADSTPLFNANERQTANAAQALCDALDTQNIDDMYVKYSFFVVGEDESFTISDIPTQVVKGDKIVISGVDTANAGKTVAVEMISTAFAAVPKETVGSAAFIVVTTKVADDGTWEVTLDTSDLNVDEYSLSVAIDSVTKKNVNVDVVAAADKPDTPDTPDVPDTPDTPVTPTEPETPGFGALAALAGLGAVAVLLLRRE